MEADNDNIKENIYSKYRLVDINILEGIVNRIDGAVIKRYESLKIDEVPDKKYSRVELIGCDNKVCFNVLNDDLVQASKDCGFKIVNKKNKILSKI